LSYTLRPLEPPSDYQPLAGLLNQINATPTTPEALAEDDGRLPAATIRQRIVAVNEHGALVGYGLARRFPWEREGLFLIKASVAPDCRRQGIGTALADAAAQFALAQGATAFQTIIRDDDDASVAYARRRGYALERHLITSTLDVTRFDDAHFRDAIQALQAGSIRFTTLADEPGEATERGLYELDKHASADNPGEDLPDFLPFADWRRLSIGRSDVRPDLVLIAKDGDRVIGMSDMAYTAETRSIYTGFTGVHRDYRGRGIALALKVLAVAAARRLGAATMRTENDARNLPMLAVNRRLGYVPAPGVFELRRDVR
jgi:GNAT superfamily N-acetyltransferase